MVGIRAQQKAARHDEILEAALEEFIEHGYAAARLEDVAARVGVTKGTIYFYFGSKEGVFEAAVRKIAGVPLAAFNAEAFPSTGRVVDDVVAYLRRMYHFTVTTPRMRETFRLLLAEAKRFPALVDAYIEQFMDPVLHRLAALLDEAVLSGAIRADMPDLVQIIAAPPMAQIVIMLLFGDRRRFDVDVLLETQARLMVGGILSQEGGGPDNWTRWRHWAGPGHDLTAPLQSGVYEIRLQDGASVLLRESGNIAASLAGTLAGDGSDVPAALRRFVRANLGRMEYRSLVCATRVEARRAARRFDQRLYRFPA